MRSSFCRFWSPPRPPNPLFYSCFVTGPSDTTMTWSRCLRKTFLLLTLSVLSLCLLEWLSGFQALTDLSSSTVSTWRSRNLTILLWYWPFGKASSLKGDVCWDLYRIPGCRLVDQRSFFSSADVVVFHSWELVLRKEKLPLHLPRPPGQRWAWMSMEAPVRHDNRLHFANIFNMTVTFRRDADVTVPYGELKPREAGAPLVEDVPKNKSYLVCWVVSNYKRAQKRARVYRELSAVVPVKVYGRWSRAPLTTGALLPKISHCYFYLAFENTLSKDYITEKLWRNAYRGGAVPVVLGPSVDDYRSVAPPHSFIHVDEFASVKDLAEYLQQLSKDEKRYGEYFSWRHRWDVKLYTDWRERLCKICSQYDQLPPQKVYSDLQACVSARNSEVVNSSSSRISGRT